MKRHIAGCLAGALTAGLAMTGLPAPPAGADGLTTTVTAVASAAPLPTPLPTLLPGDQHVAHTVVKVSAEMDDGVLLSGCLVRPVGAGPLPTILQASPHFGQMSPLRRSCDDESGWDDTDPNTGGAIPVLQFLDHGYAVAMFNIRGTGDSGGCLDMWGTREQKDMGELADWAGAQPWSTGRVGMMGLSWDAGAAIEAATQVPKALKAIVVSGIMSDIYTLEFTPQGAEMSFAVPYRAAFSGVEGVVPPRSTDPEFLTRYLNVAADRLCPELVHVSTSTQTAPNATERDRSFYEPRRFIDRFDQVKAAVLLAHGANDSHVYQEDLAWQALRRAPKKMLFGPWVHEWPDTNQSDSGQFMTHNQWYEHVLNWFDSYVKTDGSDPTAGTVQYQDPLDKRWYQTTSWPPREARDEVLYLSGTAAQPLPGDATGDRTFLAAQTERVLGSSNGAPIGPFGRTVICDPTGDAGLLYTGPVVAGQDAMLAGNPYVWLDLSSTRPGGAFRVSLVDLAPDFTCTGTDATGWRYLASGNADLRFAEGNLTAHDFPTDGTKRLRVDFANFSTRIPAGHRIGVVISGTTDAEVVPPLETPQLTVHAETGINASQVVLPVVQGSLGGSRLQAEIPARPFGPSTTRQEG